MTETKLSNKEKTELIKEKLALQNQDLYKVLDVQNVNHKPHPFTVGTQHVVHASDHCYGILGEETLRKIPCAHRGCNIPYDQHTSDNVCFLQQKRHGTQDEAQKILKQLVDDISNTNLVDGFGFVDTPEKYRIKAE